MNFIKKVLWKIPVIPTLALLTVLYKVFVSESIGRSEYWSMLGQFVWLTIMYGLLLYLSFLLFKLFVLVTPKKVTDPIFRFMDWIAGDKKKAPENGVIKQ